MIVFTFFLPVIGLPIIAFSHKYEYQGPQYERADKKFDIPLFIIASILAIVFGIFCCYINCTDSMRVIDAYKSFEDKYNASDESNDSSVSYMEIAKEILPSLDPKTSYVTVEYNGNPITLGFTGKHMSLPDDNGKHNDFCLDVLAYNEDNSDYYRLWIYDKAKALDYFGSAVDNSMNEVYDSFDNNTDKQTVNICNINFTATEINDSNCKVVFGRSDDDNVEFIVYTSLSDNNAIDKLTTCLTVEPNSDDDIDESSETNTSTSHLPDEKNNYVTVEYNDSPVKLRVTDKCMAVFHNFDLSDTDTEFFLSAAFIDEDTSSDYNIEIWDKTKMLDYYGSRFEDHTYTELYEIFDNSESKDKQTVNIGGINFTVINCDYDKKYCIWA